MRSDEYVVEELLLAKSKIATLEEDIEQLELSLEAANETISEYEEFIEMLKKHKYNDLYTYGVCVKTYDGNGEEDIEYLKSFLEEDEEKEDGKDE